MSQNQLDQESSPYLLLHKDNPVHWRPWGREALAEAEAQNKPILLSIGYTACHWCHVMNNESFADAETAALMNDNFINIKVDREERPDLDQLYQAASNAMGSTGGWPLTIFLTPKGVPFFAGTYFPKEERFGQPAFKSVLDDVTKLYREQAEPVARRTTQLTQQLNNLWNRDMRAPLDSSVLDTCRHPHRAAIRHLLRRHDRPAEIPADRSCRTAVARLSAHRHARNSCRSPPRRSTPCCSPASTIMSAAASSAMRPTNAGWSRISRSLRQTTRS